MANLLEGWDKIRRWLDNEPEDAVPVNIEKAHDNKSESELFMLRLLSEIEAVLKREIVRVPNTNRAYAPDKYIVYLSDETDKKLRRDKREFFEQGLSVLILDRAKELAGDLQLTAKKMIVEIATDPTLEKEIEVRGASKNDFETVQTIGRNGLANGGETIDDYGTIRDASAAALVILYRVEIWQGNNRLNEYPIIQRINTIGRDDGQKAANLRLPSDNRKISRFHAEIALEENGEIWVKALHKNPTIVSGQVIRAGERAKLGADGEIMIYDFTLKLKFGK
jgi:hypothetical protein